MLAEEPIIQVLSNIGVTGITALLAFLWIKKDKQYTQLTDRLADAFKKHAEVNTKLTMAVNNNSKVTEKLETTITTRLFEVLKTSGK